MGYSFVVQTLWGVLCSPVGTFFGLIGYFGVSVMNANISVNNMLFWRFLISSLFLGALLIPHVKKLTFDAKELAKITFYGAVFYGTCSILYFVATQYIGSGLSMVIFLLIHQWYY